jgi:hypothetical protein
MVAIERWRMGEKCVEYGIGGTPFKDGVKD